MHGKTLCQVRILGGFLARYLLVEGSRIGNGSLQHILYGSFFQERRFSSERQCFSKALYDDSRRILDRNVAYFGRQVEGVVDRCDEIILVGREVNRQVSSSTYCPIIK